MDKIGDSATYLADHLHEVPAMVIPCMTTRVSPNAELAEQAGLWGSILPAVWNFMLAARARGIGSAWTTMHLVNEEEVNEALGIPSHAMQAALIPIGYFTGEDFRIGLRRPAEEITYFNGWKQF
jgi:nitroreductase